MSAKDHLRFYNLSVELNDLKNQYRNARKNYDPSWLKIKRKIYSLEREKKLLDYKLRFTRIKPEPTEALKTQKLTFVKHLLNKSRDLYYKLANTLTLFRNFIDFPDTNHKSMYLPERRLSLKIWKDKHNSLNVKKK